MVSQLIIGTLTISVLHGLIPSHWIPILAFGKKFDWNRKQVYRIAIISALFHALSTVLLGILIGFLSFKFTAYYEEISRIVFAALLVIVGLVFIIRHHRHNHFHLHNEEQLKQMNSRKVITVLVLGMFLSPCLEIEGYYLIAGALGIKYIVLISLIYIIISVAGIVFWLSIAKSIMEKINTHKIEHNSGLISGVVLILTGVLTYFLH